MNTSIREVNKKKRYTLDQLQRWKKFEGKYLDVYLHHFDLWVNGQGWETVYEVKGMTERIRENYLSVEEIGCR